MNFILFLKSHRYLIRVVRSYILDTYLTIHILNHMHKISVQFSWVTHLCSTHCNPMDCSTPGLPVHHQLPGYTQTHDRWVSDAIKHLIFCCSLLLQSIFPASGYFPLSQLFTSSGQSIGVWASISVLTMDTLDWYPLGWTGWISLQCKGLSRVFFHTTVQKHQFFGIQLSL